jgi:hypothetical protein
VRITKDGYMTAMPRVARTGIQLYAGWEMGVPDQAVVRVYRPEQEVFHVDSLQTFGHRPITLRHPPEMVDAKNWREYAVGMIGGDVARDGDFIRIPMTIMDHAAIEAIKDGTDQLSVGYAAGLKWEPGTTPSGEMYDAMQTEIRVNHVALVETARGGSKLKLSDTKEQKKEKLLDGKYFDSVNNQGEMEAAISAIDRAEDRADAINRLKRRAYALGLKRCIPKDWDDGVTSDKRRQSMSDTPNLRPMVIDGVSAELPELSAQIVSRALADRDEKIKSLTGQVEQQNNAASQSLNDQRKLIDQKDGEILALKRQLAELELTPQKLDKLVRDRHDIVQKAKAIMGDTYICDGRTDIEIKRAVVAARYGEQIAKGLSDEGVTGAFMTMTADTGKASDLARAVGDAATGGTRGVHSAQDAAAVAYNERNARLQNAWRQTSQQQAAVK